ncbi:hypothetical protein MGYG_04313 [Nannizzia gypsea CBS 118893]|uniref:Uncharacterized protein n=1 Tax=Arthroderma gypseum (strain ATCC MYA-4604 / CBS 118893) TaxID=535722 RepID=E4USA3_ARTGP|nr:hypothetical protein MGYG_04313 [Nannizzia gypsea CBS 118893]EFR01307.1 hypothetical protein MGYG_04313 [Nannizzia gypsea CBS 118893]
MSSNSTSNGPGRWRGGARGTRRGGRSVRGRSGGGRGGGRQLVADRDLSPKAGAVVQRFRQRQKDLGQIFRKVAAVQKSAVLALATRSEALLIKDPKAHMASNLYSEVLQGLEKKLRKAEDLIEKEYNYRERNLDVWRETEEFRIKTHFENKIDNVMNEHIIAAQGSFMETSEKSRIAADEDHTETEESASEPRTPVSPRFARGFDSSFVRDPEGAALYEREAELPALQDGDGINGRFTNPRFSRLMGALVEACDIAEGKKPKIEEVEEPNPLDALANAALDRGEVKKQPPEPSPKLQQLPPTSALLQPPPNLPAPSQPEQQFQQPQPQYGPMRHEPHRPLLPQPLAPPLYPPSTDMRRYSAPQFAGPPPPHLHPPFQSHPHVHPDAPPQQQLPPVATRSQSQVLPHLSEHLRLPNIFPPRNQHLPPLQEMGYHRPSLPPPPYQAPHPPHQPPPPPPSMQAPPHGIPMGYPHHPQGVYSHPQYLPPPPNMHYHPHPPPPPPPPPHQPHQPLHLPPGAHGSQAYHHHHHQAYQQPPPHQPPHQPRY